jgi:hypothetical protein
VQPRYRAKEELRKLLSPNSLGIKIEAADLPEAPVEGICPGFSRSWMMKKLFLLTLSVLSLLILPCTSAVAQPPVWPPCCAWTPKIVQGGMPFLQAKLDVSNQALQLQKLTRDQLLDQISGTFFPGKKVDLVILSKQTISKPVFIDSVWTLMFSEETIYYRTPRSSITKDYLDLVTEIGLTDGESWVKINFKDDPVNPDPK